MIASSTSFLNLSLKMGPWWVLWIFPSVLANAFAFSLSFSVDFPFELITGLLLVVWDFLPRILLNVFQSILLSLASSRSFVFFRHQVSLSFLTALAIIIFSWLASLLCTGFWVFCAIRLICLFNLISLLVSLDMKNSISLTLLLGHDLSNAALIIFARVSQATSISDGHLASVLIRLLMIYFLNLDQSVFSCWSIYFLFCLIIFDELIVKCTGNGRFLRLDQFHM